GQIIGPVAAGFLAQMSGDFFLASITAAIVLVVSGAITWSAAPKSP
ncbi:YbfB/YjiJ family MFS transporter, partial [Mesorhizobium sp. M7A.F.Ca.CA.002.07.1.1]